MLDEQSWETLKSRRIQLQLTNLYKIQHNLIDVEGSRYLTKWSTTVRSKQSSQLNLHQPSSDQFKFSFFPRPIIHWNSLPASVAEAPSLRQFKKELSTQPFLWDFFQLWYLVVALKLCRRGLVPGSATQAGEVNLLVPMGYHSCVFFPIFLTFIYMAYP